MATMRDSEKVTTPRSDSYSIYKRHAVPSHGTAKALLALVVVRLVILTTVAALVALVVAVAS